MNRTIINDISFTSPQYDTIRMWLRDNISPQDLDIDSEERWECFGNAFDNTVVFGGVGWRLRISIDTAQKAGSVTVDIEDDTMAVMFALMARDL
jgi:hypothetical protein